MRFLKTCLPLCSKQLADVSGEMILIKHKPPKLLLRIHHEALG